MEDFEFFCFRDLVGLGAWFLFQDRGYMLAGDLEGLTVLGRVGRNFISDLVWPKKPRMALNVEI